MKSSIYNIAPKPHPAELERDNFRNEANTLRQSVSQKDSEINSLKDIVSISSSNLAKKDLEISQLTYSRAQVQPTNSSAKDIEINELKKEIVLLKEKLAEYKHLTEEKTEMVYLLKTSLEELKFDKIDLRKDKLALLQENEHLKKQLMDFSLISDPNPLENMPVMGFGDHTVVSEMISEESELLGSSMEQL